MTCMKRPPQPGHPDQERASLDLSAIVIFTITEFCGIHKICRTTVYKEINTGRLRVMRVGKRTLVSAEAAADWRALCEATSSPTGRA
jgi:hypothetical protein